MPRDESLAAATKVRNVDDDAILTVHDAARLLNVSVSWVYARTHGNLDDRLPSVLGKYLRFDRTDLHTYIDAKRAASRRRPVTVEAAS